MSIADIVIICILAAAVAAATVFIVKRRKKASVYGCSGNCAACAASPKENKNADLKKL